MSKTNNLKIWRFLALSGMLVLIFNIADLMLLDSGALDYEGWVTFLFLTINPDLEYLLFPLLGVFPGGYFYDVFILFIGNVIFATFLVFLYRWLIKNLKSVAKVIAIIVLLVPVIVLLKLGAHSYMQIPFDYHGK